MQLQAARTSGSKLVTPIGQRLTQVAASLAHTHPPLHLLKHLIYGIPIFTRFTRSVLPPTPVF